MLEGDKAVKKRYIPIAVLFACTFFLALVGFNLPSKEEKVPVRVLIDNAAGKTVFDHKVHETYGFACVDCHHDMSPNASDEEIAQNAVACRSCHGADIESEKFVQNHLDYFKDPMQCVTCHHVEYTTKVDWGHQMHIDIGMDCLTCHHDTDIEPEPMNCDTCHSRGYTPEGDPMPSLKNAVHDRCITCHLDMFAPGLSSCNTCHTDAPSSQKLANNSSFTINAEQAKCVSCHIEASPNELMPSTMDAFHGSCIGCHEMVGAGPYTPEQCAQCHT